MDERGGAIKPWMSQDLQIPASAWVHWHAQAPDIQLLPIHSSMLPHPKLTAALSSPFTRSSLITIRTALTRSAQDYTLAAADPEEKEKHAAVLIPLCNVNDKPSILLELRGKLRTHSGEVRCDNCSTRIARRNISPAIPTLLCGCV
jgi:hypothetical protein